METKDKTAITLNATVHAPIEIVWKLWTSPEDITQWNSASDDWHTPRAENDLKAGGKFTWRMEAKDGTMGFDFGGEYTNVQENERIAYTLGDERKVEITFKAIPEGVLITETFEAETTNPIDMQRNGWQAILNNFKKYAESK